MSFMRNGWVSRYFKHSETKSYVFPSAPDNKIEDYDDKYEDDKSFIELLARFVELQTKDKDYVWKIVKILAKKLGVEKELRVRPASIMYLLDKTDNKVKRMCTKLNKEVV